MAIQFNAGKPVASEFTVAPGEYKLRVIEAKQDISKGGNDMIKLKLRIIKKDGSDGPALYDYLVFSESSFWKIDTFLTSCDEHPGEGEAIIINCDNIIGWECLATLGIEKYDGKDSNKVKAYLFDNEF